MDHPTRIWSIISGLGLNIYDKHGARLEEHEKVLIDHFLEGKTRERLGLKPFTCTEILSDIMGILVTITEETIAKACRR